MRGIALTMLFALTGVAHAGTDAEEPPGAPSSKPAASSDTKSEDTAFWLSAGGAGGSLALVGVGLAVGAIFPGGNPDETRLLKVPLHNWGNGIATAGLLASGLAPSFGEWYSGHFLTGGLGLRIAGAAVMGIGTIKICGADTNEYGCSATNNNGLIAIGAIAYGAGVIYDVANARSAARDYNAEHAHVAFSPAPVPHGYGLVLAGSF